MALEPGRLAPQGEHDLPGVPLAAGPASHRHTPDASGAGILSLPACVFSTAAFKGNPKAQAGRALGEEQVQVQVQTEVSATAAPPIRRPWSGQSPPDHPEQQNGGQTTNRDVPESQAAQHR